MPGVILDRRRFLILGSIAVLAGAWIVWFFHPDRQLERAWVDLLDTVAARNTTRLGRILADDYGDRWGYTRQTMLDDARLAFFRFRQLEITAEKVRKDRRGAEATITAILRMSADGGGQVDEARVAVNALFTPFTFEWRRERGFFGSWRLIQFDHPELDLTRFRMRWS